MKITFFDRLLAAIAGLMLLLVGVAVILVSANVLSVDGTIGTFLANLPLWAKIAVICGGAIFVGLGLHGILLLFTGKQSNYVKKEMDDGSVNISIKTLENLARRCAESHKSVNVRRVVVLRDGGSVQIQLEVLVPSGVNIPEVIGTLQKHVSQYVNDCSGIGVEYVAVQVETDPGAKGLPPRLTSGDEEEPSMVPEKPAPVAEPVQSDKVAVPSDTFSQEPVESAL